MTFRMMLWRLIDIYQLIILVECILSWFAPSMGGVVRDIYEALKRLTEPFLGIFRRAMPDTGIGIDFSPVIAIVILDILKRLLFRF